MNNYIDFILQIVIILLILFLSIRINNLEYNYKCIKEWLKVLGVIDLDKITDVVREYQNELEDDE